MLKILSLIFLISFQINARDLEKSPTNKTQAPWPALILLHDVWGMDNFMKREVERYSDAGFYVYAIDYYSGKQPADMRDAERFKDKLSREDIIGKVKRTIEKLQKSKKVDKNRMGILGWGYGGTLALRVALQSPELRTMAMAYGEPVNEVSELKKLRSRGFAVFGDKDNRNGLTNVNKFKSAVEESKMNIEVHILPNAGYGFFDYTRTDGFNPQAAEEGKKLLMTFLNRHLSLTEYIK